MSERPTFLKFEHLLLAGIIVAYAAIFIIDLQTPMGFAWGMPYAIIVMATYWVKSRRITVGAGILGTGLTAAGFFLLNSSQYLVVDMFNRLMAIIVIWASVWFVNRYKTSLDKIKKNKKRISALFEAAIEGIIISDIKGHIVMVNEKTEELFGYSREELIGVTIERLVPSRHRSAHKLYRQDYYKDPAPRPMGKDRDLYGLKKNGEEFPVEVNLNHFETEEGKFYISNVTDITELKKAEIQLFENERRYRMLFKGATDEILVFQVDNNMIPLPFMEVNDAACNILGYSRGELLQKTIYDIVAAEKENVQEWIREVIKSGKQIYKSKHGTKEGNIIPLEISARSFSYMGRTTIISIGRDVRERRRLEQEVLNISERERQRIGRDLHDDIGQLLTMAKLNADILKNKVKSGKKIEPNEVEGVIDVINTTTERARLLSHSLVPSDIQSKGLSYALQDLVRELSTLYDIRLNYKGWAEDIPLRDSNSATHLYRIVQEAINNAIKHGNATTIDVELNAQEDHITLSIEDNGKGFSELEEMSGGMGIRGMHFRAQMVGGNLEIKSEKGKGTKVFYQIPLTAITHNT